MPAYAVFIRDRTIDAAEMAQYAQMAPATAEGRPVTVHAFYGPQEVLEGPPAEGVVILEFPTMADAKSWYESPAYQEAKAHRLRGAEYRVILVEGATAIG